MWASAKHSPPDQRDVLSGLLSRLHVLMPGTLTNGTLNEAKSWATNRDLSHLRKSMILQL